MQISFQVDGDLEALLGRLPRRKNLSQILRMLTRCYASTAKEMEQWCMDNQDEAQELQMDVIQTFDNLALISKEQKARKEQEK
jgi:hypothetical protein